MLYEHALMLRYTTLLVLFNMSFSLVNNFLCVLRCLLIHFRSQSLSTVNYQQCILGNDPVQIWQTDTNVSKEPTASDKTAVFISTGVRVSDLA